MPDRPLLALTEDDKQNAASKTHKQTVRVRVPTVRVNSLRVLSGCDCARMVIALILPIVVKYQGGLYH
jgi:hypothetical protein